mgnify:CR=1 FL=1
MELSPPLQLLQLLPVPLQPVLLRQRRRLLSTLF